MPQVINLGSCNKFQPHLLTALSIGHSSTLKTLTFHNNESHGRIEVVLLEMNEDNGLPEYGKYVATTGTRVHDKKGRFDRADGMYACGTGMAILETWEVTQGLVITAKHLNEFVEFKGDITRISNHLSYYEQIQAQQIADYSPLPPNEAIPMTRGVCSPVKPGEDGHIKVATALLKKEKKNIRDTYDKWMRDVSQWRKENFKGEENPYSSTSGSGGKPRKKSDPWANARENVKMIKDLNNENDRLTNENEKLHKGGNSEEKALKEEVEILKEDAVKMETRYITVVKEKVDFKLQLKRERESHDTTKAELASQRTAYAHLEELKAKDCKIARMEGTLAAAAQLGVSPQYATPNSQINASNILNFSVDNL